MGTKVRTERRGGCVKCTKSTADTCMSNSLEFMKILTRIFFPPGGETWELKFERRGGCVKCAKSTAEACTTNSLEFLKILMRNFFPPGGETWELSEHCSLHSLLG